MLIILKSLADCRCVSTVLMIYPQMLDGGLQADIMT